MDDKDAYSNLRVESFSCYLNSAKENFARNLTGRISNSSYSTDISSEDSPYLISMGIRKNNDPEIGVLGADKYYNTKQQYNAYASTNDLEKERSSVELPQPNQNLRSKTWCISSEASSLNSQSALLQDLSRNPSQTKHKRGLGARIFQCFCKGYCTDKKAVYISGRVHDIQLSKTDLKKVDQFTFPLLDSDIETVTVKTQLEEEKEIQEDPRNSLDVFGSFVIKKGDVAANMERKLSILTWDAIPKKCESLATTTFGSSAMCDDMASDASSDLFEIDNIAGTRCPVLSMQESCNMSGCMTPTAHHYAPSEANIECSVVTVSAADFSSAVSEFEGKSVSVTGDMISKRATNRINNHKDSGTKEVAKSSLSRLLGCRSLKAVIVAESHC